MQNYQQLTNQSVAVLQKSLVFLLCYPVYILWAVIKYFNYFLEFTNRKTIILLVCLVLLLHVGFCELQPINQGDLRSNPRARWGYWCEQKVIMDIVFDYSQIISWILILIFGVISLLFSFLSYKQIARTYPKEGNTKLKGALVLCLYISIITCSVLIIMSLIISKGNFLAALFIFFLIAPFFLPLSVIAAVVALYSTSLVRGQIINGIEHFLGWGTIQ